MSSIRSLLVEANILLERSQSADHAVVREVMLQKATRQIARAEVMARIGVSEFPTLFLDAIIEQRQGVIIECPRTSREEMLELRAEQDPSHFTEKTVGSLQ